MDEVKILEFDGPLNMDQLQALKELGFVVKYNGTSPYIKTQEDLELLAIQLVETGLFGGIRDGDTILGPS